MVLVSCAKARSTAIVHVVGARKGELLPEWRAGRPDIPGLPDSLPVAPYLVMLGADCAVGCGSQQEFGVAMQIPQQALDGDVLGRNRAVPLQR